MPPRDKHFVHVILLIFTVLILVGAFLFYFGHKSLDGCDYATEKCASPVGVSDKN